MGARSGKREKDKEEQSKGDRYGETNRDTENGRPRKTTIDNARLHKTKHDRANQREGTQDIFESKLQKEGTLEWEKVGPEAERVGQGRSWR